MDKGHTLSDTQAPSPPGEPELAPRLIVAMECDRPLRLPSSHSLAGVDEVVIGRGDERAYHRLQHGDRTVLKIDIPCRRMSSTHCYLRRQADGWFIEDANSKNGTFVDGSPVRTLRLPAEAQIEAGRTIFLFSAEVLIDDGNKRDFDLGHERSGTLVTLSNTLDREYRRLARIAPASLPVLILGETGTGKEVTARALHLLSGRSGQFVAVNCGALAETLIESELFGHKRGAFSGATEDRPGLFRAANGGTIFLDEIAELPADSQAALLRVLQEGEVRPVGGTDIVRVDVRVVAATLRDLPARVTSGEFRQDLYARITGITIELPPLRARREDVGLLCSSLLRKLAQAGRTGGNIDDVRIDRVAGRALFAYPWPLNVRELEHTLAAALALADGLTIELDNLPDRVRGVLDAPDPTPTPIGSTRDQTLHKQLITLLSQHSGNVSAVARAMGKAPMQIYRWLKRLQIDVENYR